MLVARWRFDKGRAPGDKPFDLSLFFKENRLSVNSDLIFCSVSDQGRAVEQRIQCSGESWPQVRDTWQCLSKDWDSLTHFWEGTRSKSYNYIHVPDRWESAATCNISAQQNRSAVVAWPAPGAGGLLSVPRHFSNQHFSYAGFVSVICAYLTLGLDHSNWRQYTARPENCSQAMVWRKPAQLRSRVVTKLFPRWPHGPEFHF